MSDTAWYESPIGTVRITAGDEAITSVAFARLEPEGTDGERPDLEYPLLQLAVRQLDEYFRGARRSFSLPLAVHGTPFQQDVRRHVSAIPYGETRFYRDIAGCVRNGRVVRAVGSANRLNPFLLVIPCRRVIGANGQLTGYAGGIWRKEWLLLHEGAVSAAGDSTRNPAAAATTALRS